MALSNLERIEVSHGLGQRQGGTHHVGMKVPTATISGRQCRNGISLLAPAYYQGRPAQVWFEALRPRRSPTPDISVVASTAAPGVDQSGPLKLWQQRAAE